MPREYEYQFIDFDKNNIINKIKKKSGKYMGTFLFKVQVFEHPTKKPLTYIRVRDEGYKITLTYKFKNSNSEYFQEETETNISDFNAMCTILVALGCKKLHYYEKIREIWKIKDNIEIVFDTIPMLPDIMEIESTKKVILDDITKSFGLTIDKKIYVDVTVEKLYGFSYKKNINATFSNMKNYSKYVKKNKQVFNMLIKSQYDKYYKLI